MNTFACGLSSSTLSRRRPSTSFCGAVQQLSAGPNRSENYLPEYTTLNYGSYVWHRSCEGRCLLGLLASTTARARRRPGLSVLDAGALRRTTSLQFLSIVGPGRRIHRRRFSGREFPGSVLPPGGSSCSRRCRAELDCLSERNAFSG